MLDIEIGYANFLKAITCTTRPLPKRDRETGSITRMKATGTYPCMLAAAAIAWSAGGCAHYSVNAPLKSFAPHAGYRFENFPATQDNSDELFVVLALSGGGARAAAFSYGVLEE